MNFSNNMRKRLYGLILIAAALGSGCGSLTAVNNIKPKQQPPTEQSTATEPFYADMQDYLEDFLLPAPLIDSRATTSQKTIKKTSAAERYTVDATYPSIRGIGAPRITTAINQDIAAVTQKKVNDFIADVRAWNKQSGEKTTRSTLETSYHPYILTNDIVSILMQSTHYNADAAHPFHSREALIYDVKNGTKVSLRDFFKTDADYLEQLSRLALQEAEAEYNNDHSPGVSELFADFMAPKEENFSDYALTKDGFIFFFQLYGAGPTISTIPWSSVTGVLNPSGPARFFITSNSRAFSN